MTQIEISALCAAYIVGFDAACVDMFLSYRDRLLHSIEDNHLVAEVMVDRHTMSTSELMETILDALNKVGSIYVEGPECMLTFY